MNEEFLHSLQAASGVFCGSIVRKSRAPRLVQVQLYQDYELVDRQPMLVGQGFPTLNSAHMVFKVKLLDPRLGERQGAFAFIKVSPRTGVVCACVCMPMCT